MELYNQGINSSRLRAIFARIAYCCAAAVALFGLLVIIGWVFHLSFIVKPGVQGLNVKTNTGICFYLAGISLLLQLSSALPPARFPMANVCAFLVFLIGLLTLIEHLSGFSFGIDQLIFSNDPAMAVTVSPNRMGPPAAFCFTLGGLGLMALSTPDPRFRNLTSRLGLIIGVVGLLSTIGHLFGAQELYGIARFTGIAFTTATCFLFLSIAMIFGSARSDLVALLSSEDAGGMLARRMMPPAIILPPLLVGLRILGERLGYYDMAFGRAMLNVIFIVVLLRLVWSSAVALAKIDKERMELINSERSARTNAERASRYKDEFLATVSHELRTPLNAILGWSQLLKRKGDLSPDLLTGLDTIERNSRIQAQLIDDLLDMSRIVSGKFHLKEIEVDLVLVLQQALNTMALTAQNKSIRIERIISAPTAMVKGDPERLQQIFVNLLSNALKFTPTGGEVSAICEIIGDKARVSITDTGQGIAPELISHIFERFTQADGSITRRHGGLGIGLSVVRDLVTLQGGTVVAESAGSGQGSVFTVTFPLSENGERAPENFRTRNYSETLTFANLDVLVVDDDADARELTGRILKQYQAKVRYASSAEEALDAVKENRPDVLVSDIGMPGRDGYFLIQTIRSFPENMGRDLPAVALTAFVRPEDLDKALASGYHAHLSKPVDAFELTSTINRLASRKMPPATDPR